MSVELGGARILDGVSGSVEAGEWVTVIGPNGAGKSTLLRAVAGLVQRPGAVEIGGDDGAALGRRELARRVALVPQLPELPPAMTVAEYVLLGRTPHLGYLGREGGHDLEVADAALVRLDLVDFAVAPPRDAERRRAPARRARARASRSRRRSCSSTSRRARSTSAAASRRSSSSTTLRREAGLTVLAAMHDLTLAGQYADRLLLLDGGRVVAAGLVDDVLTDELIARHYGASVRVLRDDDGSIVVLPVRRG